jgi:putative serine protease PepD
VINGADALTAAVQSKAPGSTITLNYLDPSGLTQTTQVVLGTEQGPQSQ